MAHVPTQAHFTIEGSEGGLENYCFNKEEPSQFPPSLNGEATVKKLDEPTRCELLPEEMRGEKIKVWKSLLCLCFSLTLGFAASMTLANSITSLLPIDNLGISALAVAGASQLICAAFLVPIATKLWGARRILQSSLVTNGVFVLMFWYPSWATIMFGSFCFGITQALLVSTGFMYANSAGYWLEKLVQSGNVDAVLVRVSGMVNCALGSGFLWGNLALYFILGAPPEDDGQVDFKDLCGAAYCNQELNISTMEPPSPERRYGLVGLLTAMGILGAGLIFLTEDFDNRLGHVCCSKAEAWTEFRNTWRLVKNPRGFLLIPITMMIGMEESFVVGDITKAFVSCSFGISMVGLVMLTYGIVEIPVSLGNWPLVKKFGRTPVVGIAVVVLLIPIIVMLSWPPDPKQVPVIFFLISFWAAADSILMSVIFSTYAALFEDNLEGAFSVGIFWWSSGFLIWFGWSQFLCTYIKLYFLLALIIVSFTLYFILEIFIIKKD